MGNGWFGARLIGLAGASRRNFGPAILDEGDGGKVTGVWRDPVTGGKWGKTGA